MQTELHDLIDPAKFNGAIDVADEAPEVLLTHLRRMLMIRKAEEKIGDKVTEGLIRCPCHLAIGQEAVAVGVAHHVRPSDRGFGTHRSHSHYLAVDAPVYELFAEVLGKATGCSKGMGGSMHLWAEDRGFKGSVPIVAGTVSLAVGAGLAAEMDVRQQMAAKKSTDRSQFSADIGITYFGDGAAEEGSVHESLNMAAQMKLPVLFVCENNFFSSHLHIRLRQPSDKVSRYAEAHKVAYELVDGNDVAAVQAAAGRLIERARRGEGPGFLEAVTYRWRGHVGPREDDDVGLKRKDDLKAWKGRDPIRRLKESMLLTGEFSEKQLDDLESQIHNEVEQAWDAAIKAPYPEANALLDLVYAQWPEREGGFV
jgi:TPP-dependent pyruvate/acetoin dehydrogenase alpha subunit